MLSYSTIRQDIIICIAKRGIATCIIYMSSFLLHKYPDCIGAIELITGYLVVNCNFLKLISSIP